MRAKLEPHAYVAPEAFATERAYFLEHGWHYLGLRSELEKLGSYAVHNLWGQSVFKQRLQGPDMAAYTNVCPHRYSRLRCQDTGDDPLVCPYHGWAFDAKTGRAVGIPEKPEFCFTDTEEKELHLDPWTLETCGELVFASKKPKQGLTEYLGSYNESIKLASCAIGQKVDTNSIDIAANWKIIVENTLESYHVRKIHPETFMDLGAAGNDFAFSGYHSSWRAALNDKTKKKAKLINKIFSDRMIINDHYDHTLIFPNLTIATSFGLSFSFQEIIPLAADKTRFLSHVYLSKLKKPRSAGDDTLKSIAESIVEFNRSVFAEDKEICEAVQLGSRDAPQRGFLSNMEKRVEAFQKSILEALS